jgi:hypothetical protein
MVLGGAKEHLLSLKFLQELIWGLVNYRNYHLPMRYLRAT